MLTEVAWAENTEQIVGTRRKHCSPWDPHSGGGSVRKAETTVCWPSTLQTGPSPLSSHHYPQYPLYPQKSRYWSLWPTWALG